MDIKESTRQRTMQQAQCGGQGFHATLTRWWWPVLTAPNKGRPEWTQWRERHLLIILGQELLLTSSTTMANSFSLPLTTTRETLKSSLSKIRLQWPRPLPEWRRSSVAMVLQTRLWQTMALSLGWRIHRLHTVLGIWTCDILTTLPPS